MMCIMSNCIMCWWLECHFTTLKILYPVVLTRATGGRCWPRNKVAPGRVTVQRGRMAAGRAAFQCQASPAVPHNHPVVTSKETQQHAVRPGHCTLVRTHTGRTDVSRGVKYHIQSCSCFLLILKQIIMISDNIRQNTTCQVIDLVWPFSFFLPFFQSWPLQL